MSYYIPGYIERSFGQMLSSAAKNAGQLAAYLASLGNVDEAKLREAQERVAEKMAAELRRYVVNTFHSAGLTRRTGTLLRALAESEITVSRKGIWVKLPTKLSGEKNKLPRSVHAAAAALKYGAVRQPRTKKKGEAIWDPISGQYRERKFTTGVMGQQARTTFKRAILQGQYKARGKYANMNLGGINVIAPRPTFLRFSPADIRMLNQKQTELLREELRKMGVNL